MDDIAHYNRTRWDALANANALFSRPALDLDPASARQKIDPEGRLGDLSGKRVLCLASGGGQQSAAFALLGARVTVYDISDAQLERDREAAAHYDLSIDTVQGDMRDLSALPRSGFDIVWQPYSINFVPDVVVVFREVARVIRPGGTYCLQAANPAFFGMTPRDWNGSGYVLANPYVEGAEIPTDDEGWVYPDSEPKPLDEPVPRPRECRHTLARLINSLAGQGFIIRHLSEGLDIHPNLTAPPGTWDHFVAFAPPWLAFWSEYDPLPSGS